MSRIRVWVRQPDGTLVPEWRDEGASAIAPSRRIHGELITGKSAYQVRRDAKVKRREEEAA